MQVCHYIRVAGRNKPGPNKGEGGRRHVLRPCDWCGEAFGARDMRLHRPNCPKRETLQALVSQDARTGFDRDKARLQLNAILSRYPEFLQEIREVQS